MGHGWACWKKLVGGGSIESLSDLFPGKLFIAGTLEHVKSEL